MNVATPTQSVVELQKKNVELQAALAELQRNQAVQSKEIDILTRLIESAMHERIDAKAENAAYRVLAGLQRLPKKEENGER